MCAQLEPWTWGKISGSSLDEVVMWPWLHGSTKAVMNPCPLWPPGRQEHCCYIPTLYQSTELIGAVHIARNVCLDYRAAKSPATSLLYELCFSHSQLQMLT